MATHRRYWEEVALKYQLYNGLFLGLPFQNVRRAGILLPVLAERAANLLAEGASPVEIVDRFFRDQMVEYTDTQQRAMLFRFVQLVERQVVLFDSLEDAAFPRVTDTEGAGSLNETIARVVQAERRSLLSDAVEDFRVRVVLTAHPTQFYPSRVLGIITDLADALAVNDVPRIYDYLLQLGKTRFANRRKPTPLDEARSLLWYLENVFYHAAPPVHSRIAENARASRKSALELDPVVELGFWPGGDRDGNPFVTAETTSEVARMLRRSVVTLYIEEIQALKRRLTFEGAIERLRTVEGRLQAMLTEYCEHPEFEPYVRIEDFSAELMELWDHLHHAHEGLFVDELEELIWKVRVFGFHFATLDLRQDSRVLGRALDAIRESPVAAADQDPEKYFITLEQELHAGTLTPQAAARERLQHDHVLADTIDSLRAAQEIRSIGGEHSIHRYIISNTRGAHNLLEVYYLAALSGFEIGAVDLDIVPLFETVEDLRHAPGIMRTLYESKLYREHLRRRGDLQQIMLGFSDGTKDGGYVAANWLIYRAREELAQLARKYGVRVTFFEGRGGPPARGGGKTHQFYRGMGRASAGEQIHLTIQGQTISSNFGTVESARFNIEQLATAGLENRLLAEDFVEMTKAQRRVLERLSEISLHRYNALKQHPDFLAYLEQMTPLVYYGAANNASRPTSRGNSSELRLQDLRAIPFVGAWSQMKQNVPGFYGFGTALAELINDGSLEDLQRLYRDHLFFRTLVENSMQSISKVNMDLTRFIADDKRFANLWNDIAAELKKTKRALLDVAGAPELLPNDDARRESIRLREQIVLPVLVIQQYALALLRSPDTDEEEAVTLRKLVVKSMAAIVNAGRNSV